MFRCIAGCAEPLLHPRRMRRYVHGRDGFGDIGYRAGSARGRSTNMPRWRSCACRTRIAGRLVLVALGPLTNLASR